MMLARLRALAVFNMAAGFGIACGSVDESVQSDAGDVASIGDTASLRADGCPNSPSELPKPCTETGKSCFYSEGCTKGRAATRYVCQGPTEGPYSHGWQPVSVECSTLKDTDGCPLAAPIQPECTTPGLNCYYFKSFCTDPKATVPRFECATDAKGTWWYPRDNVPCSAFDAGS